MYSILRRRPTFEERYPCDKLYYENVCLQNFESIAKYSFVVQKSINPLDLNLREFSSLTEKRKVIVRLLFCSADPAFSRKFVSTEENCRKTLILERRILYTLHLDLAKGREDRLALARGYGMKFGPKTVCLNKLKVSDEIYKCSLISFMEETFRQKDMTINLVQKQLVLMRKFLGKRSFDVGSLEDKILNFLYLKCTNSCIVKDFLTILDFDSLLLSYTKSAPLEYLLFHAYQSRYNLRLNDRQGAILNSCYFQSRFKRTEILLQYQNAPYYYNYDSTILASSWLNRMRGNWYLSDLEIPLQRGLLSQRRYMLWLQVIHAFFTLHQPLYVGRVAKILVLLWRSLPDAFFTLDEVVRAYQDKPSIVKHNQAVYAFYAKTIGGDLDTLKPRSLKHYCRSQIRRSLCYNLQLPHGIDQLVIPPKLKSFLMLERD